MFYKLNTRFYTQECKVGCFYLNPTLQNFLTLRLCRYSTILCCPIKTDHRENPVFLRRKEKEDFFGITGKFQNFYIGIPIAACMGDLLFLLGFVINPVHQSMKSGRSTSAVSAVSYPCQTRCSRLLDSRWKTGK